MGAPQGTTRDPTVRKPTMKKIVMIAAALMAVVSLSACESVGKGKGKEPVVTKG